MYTCVCLFVIWKQFEIFFFENSEDDQEIPQSQTADNASNVQQNIEQLQTLTMGVTINKKSTTTEPPPQNGQQP